MLKRAFKKEAKVLKQKRKNCFRQIKAHEAGIKRLETQVERCEIGIIKLYHKAGIDQEHQNLCDHPFSDRTIGGAWLCSACNKMLGMD